VVRDFSSEVDAILYVLGETHTPGVAVSIAWQDDNLLEMKNAPALVLGSPVKVVKADCLWLGEVIECHPDGLATIQIVHLLKNVAELQRLADRFTGRTSGRSPVQAQPEPTLS
jgi:hypothetical protein